MKWSNNKEYKYNRDDKIKHVAKRHGFRNNLCLVKHLYEKVEKFFEKVIDKIK